MKRYGKILVALDSSNEAAQVLEHARDLAAMHDATLHLVNVVRPLHYAYSALDAGWIARETAGFEAEAERASHARLLSLARAQGIDDCELAVHLGEPAVVIREQALEVGADLIVMGSHGRHGLGLVLGSTANAVLHGMPCDILAVRIDADAPLREGQGYRRVLIAVDAVQSSVDTAMARARAAAHPEARTMVLHVMEPRTMPYSIDASLTGAMSDALEDSIRRSAREHLEALCERHDFGKDDLMIPEGRPAATIKAVAKDLDCDLVCLASHGRYGWQRLLGSTANAVLHGCSCSVLIARLEEFPASATQAASSGTSRTIRPPLGCSNSR